MAITDRKRRDLFDQLEQTIGPDQADTLMQLLPHQPADELVTITYLQTEMGALRSELRGEMSELRGEMSELRGEMMALRADTRAVIAEQIAALNVSVNRRITALATTNVVALVTALVV